MQVLFGLYRLSGQSNIVWVIYFNSQQEEIYGYQ